jgi:hypothetical protein
VGCEEANDVLGYGYGMRSNVTTVDTHALGYPLFQQEDIMPPTELTLGSHLLLWVFPLVVVVVVVAEAVFDAHRERKTS